VVVSTWQAVRATRAESKERIQRARAESERNSAEQAREQMQQQKALRGARLVCDVHRLSRPLHRRASL